jgi:hypothetical protein
MLVCVFLIYFGSYKKPPSKPKKRLKGAVLIWSGISGSNRRPIPWQGIALPTELIPQFVYTVYVFPLAQSLGNIQTDRPINLL